MSTKGKIALAAGAVIGVVAFILGAKVWLVALLGFVIYKFISVVLQKGWKGLWDAFMRINIIKLAADAIGDAISKVTSKLNPKNWFKERAYGS